MSDVLPAHHVAIQVNKNNKPEVNCTVKLTRVQGRTFTMALIFKDVQIDIDDENLTDQDRTITANVSYGAFRDAQEIIVMEDQKVPLELMILPHKDQQDKVSLSLRLDRVDTTGVKVRSGQ